MMELGLVRKNHKVNLSDYNFQQDLDLRVLIADLSSFEHELLQEIFFSSLKFPFKKLMRSLDCQEEDLKKSLEKLEKSGLLKWDADFITVDKEMRKYFEFQMNRFDPDFKPDMEFAQGLLRKVPIHVLPSWYAIPRTSNNIFESVVEKYLLTPQIFQRYIAELSYPSPVFQNIVRDVFASPDYRVSSSDIIAKYNLSRRDFEEAMLWLEFHFIVCLTYEKQDDLWFEYISPFHEWQEYLQFLKQTKAPPLPPSSKIIRKRENDFAFVEDLSAILRTAPKDPTLSSLGHFPQYLKQLVEKILLLQFGSWDQGKLFVKEEASFFLKMKSQDQALYLYRHPFNRPLPLHSTAIETAQEWGLKDAEYEKRLRTAEKSIRRVLHGDWIFFDDFLKGVTVCLSEGEELELKKVGKHWKYTIPSFDEQEKETLRETVMQWLFETGITAVGECDGRECFAVTALGRTLFEG